jgi:hypothetical protein
MAGKSKIARGALEALTDIFRSDIPRESWLKDKIDYAKSKGKDSYGHSYLGTDTGNFKYDSPTIMLPVSELKKLKGRRGEQENIKQDSLDWLLDHMGKTGKLPMTSNSRTKPPKEYAPFITVDYKGVPTVSEGNHRIMAADKLGWSEIPVQIRYFDGGERKAQGIFKPENIFEKLKGSVE